MGGGDGAEGARAKCVFDQLGEGQECGGQFRVAREHLWRREDKCLGYAGMMHLFQFRSFYRSKMASD